MSSEIGVQIIDPSTTRSKIFINRLLQLERGEKAILKRNAGRKLAEGRKVVGIFYRLLPSDVPEREEEIYFLIATLIGYNDYPFSGNFGRTMRTVKEKTKQNSLDRRFAVLLESEMDLIDGFKPGGGELAYRLRQCVKLSASQKVGVDWPRLLEDLLQWNRPDKRIQKQWAQSYYSQRFKNKGVENNVN